MIEPPPSAAFCLAVAILVSGAAVSPATQAEELAPDCGHGTGLVVLMAQDELYLNQSVRHGSTTGAILKSILASALTGGSGLVVFSPLGDGGSLLAAPHPVPADLQPLAAAQRLDDAIAETPAARRFQRQAPTIHPEEVDNLLFDTACSRVIVVNAQYTLEVEKAGVYLSLVAQVLEVPARRAGDNVTRAALEYRSARLPFTDSRDPVVVSSGLEGLLSAERTTVEVYLREGVGEVAAMLSWKFQPEDLDVVPVPMGKVLRELDCDECKKSDLILPGPPGRIWVQPARQPLATLSLPLRPE